jgi:8-oxo-dGTP pyrophosphatase MutT (NUDIX family)
MAPSLVPDCFACKHLIGINPSGGWVCRAFDRIPVDILARRVKHDASRDGDHGIQFEPGEPELVSRQDETQQKEPRGAEVQPNLRAAGVMFVDDNGHVLLLRRSDTGEWAFPGGELEDGESEEDAARRECEEETGQRPGELQPWTRRIADGVDFTTFLSRIPEQFEPELNDEHTDYRWEKLGDLEGNSLDVVTGRADDADFKESDHPRAGDGKFTSGRESLSASLSDIDPALHKSLESKKFNHEGGEQGVYKNSAGFEISILPKSNPNDRYAYKWEMVGPDGQKVSSDYGTVTLARAIGKVNRGEFGFLTSSSNEKSTAASIPRLPTS